MAVRTQTYTKKDGTVSVYTFEREYKDRTTHILVPDGVHKPYWVKVPQTSILFKEKDYPTCLGCDRKYLHELGCLWCKIKRDGKDSGTGEKTEPCGTPRTVEIPAR